jgi:hypothetical protein
MNSSNQFGRLLKGVGADMNPIVKGGAQRALQKQIRGNKYPRGVKGGGHPRHKKIVKKAIKKVVKKLLS